MDPESSPCLCAECCRRVPARRELRELHESRQRDRVNYGKNSKRIRERQIADKRAARAAVRAGGAP